jgi:hypothetical protein
MRRKENERRKEDENVKEMTKFINGFLLFL